jgi:hypothetical protein
MHGHHAQTARGTARWHAHRWLGGGPTARRQQGIARDLEGGTGEVPGKDERAGAHQNGVPTVRRRKRHRVAAFNGGGVAPVVVDEHGEVLHLEGDPGVRRRRSIEEWSSSKGAHQRGADSGDVRTESAVGEGLRWLKTGEEDAWAMGMNARRSTWMDETNGARGEKKILVSGRQLRFNGKRRGAGGGGVDTTWRRSGREREGEREGGGPGVAWSSAAIWRRCGSGLDAAHAFGTLPRDNGERRGRRDADRCG